MKRSFVLIEVLIVVSLIIIIASFFTFKIHPDNLELATRRLALYLKHTRYQALIDDKYDHKNKLWHKKRWSLKFFRCSKKAGGLYYNIYSDNNMKGHPSLDESLNDPLTNKKIYSSNQCEINPRTSEYVLLTKKFNIQDVQISCNSTGSLGQLSFGNDGRVYTRLSSSNGKFYEYELKNICKIKLIDNKKTTKTIKIYPKTGYISIQR